MFMTSPLQHICSEHYANLRLVALAKFLCPQPTRNADSVPVRANQAIACANGI